MQQIGSTIAADRRPQMLQGSY